MARHGARIVGCTGILRRTITVGRRRIRVAGLGGVITRERWRRRGIAAHMLVTAEHVMRDILRCEHAILLCTRDIVPVYTRAGWKLVDADVIHAGIIEDDLPMVLQLGERPWPAGPIDLCGLPW